MDAFLKKHFWVVNLVALGLLAWMVSASFNDWVGSKLFAVPKITVAKAKTDKAGNASERFKKAPATVAADLTRWSLFNRNPTPPSEEKKDETEEVKDEQPKEIPDDELPESELTNLKLVGTMVSSDPARSMATMMVDNKNRLAWVGNSFLDGKVKLARIGARHVVVNEDGAFKVIKLWADKVAAGRGKGRLGRRSTTPSRARPAARPAARPNSRLAQLKNKREEMRKHIRKTGPYAYNVARSYLEKNMENMGSLGKQARIVPNYRGGRTQGYKLVGVRPGSLFRALGVRSGDVIKSVNGTTIDSPSKALGLFEKLKTQSNVSLEIERRGQPKELSYTIQ